MNELEVLKAYSAVLDKYGPRSKEEKQWLRKHRQRLCTIPLLRILSKKAVAKKPVSG